jgi:hypothetical protein
MVIHLLYAAPQCKKAVLAFATTTCTCKGFSLYPVGATNPSLYRVGAVNP